MSDAIAELSAEVARLGDLTVERETDLQARADLAVAVGRLVNASVQPAYAPPRPPKVITLFPFFNEFTILKIRLREMAEWVDEFVIVEAAATFTGRPKPYHLDTAGPLIAEFGAKVTRVRIDAFPDCCRTPWAREFYQRDYAIKGLEGLWGPEDVILVTDADEIVARGAVDRFEGEFANLMMRTHSFFLNYCAKAGTKQASRNSGFVCRPSMLREAGSSALRVVTGPKAKALAVSDAGWHLTSMGGAAALTEKCQNFAHQESTKANLRDRAYNERMLGRVRAGADHPAWERRDIDESFPAYVREHPDELGDLIL